VYPSLNALSDMARRYSELEEKHLQHQADSSRRYSELEEKYSQGQIDLAQVSASLDDTHFLNSSLNAQLDSERAANEVSLFNWLCRALLYTGCLRVDSCL
jgi:RNA polymerase-interacting CarD/CdnL/TRCF family regulator